MSDKKISQLDNASTPLAGTELVPMVQSGATVKSLLSTIRSYLFNGTKDFTGGDVNINNNGAGAVFVNVGDTDDAAIIRLNRNGANYIDMPATAGSLIFRTQSGFTTRLTLATNGDTTLNTGNLVIGTSGKGIDFSADGSAAGMTSELLDDYEEGTWTPAFSGTGWTLVGDPVVYGKYIKVGQQVYVYGRMAYTTSMDSAGGNTTISGLPYAGSSNITVTPVLFVLDNLGLPGERAYSRGAGLIYVPAFTAGTASLNFEFTYFVD